MNDPFAFSDPESALLAISDDLSVVTETETTDDPLGRVLARPVLADRDSPAADVSAMDGYGIRLEDLNDDRDLPVSGQCPPGAAPPEMKPGHVIRIFTGAVIPDGCEAVIKREDTVESTDSIRILAATIESTVAGSHIRRAGENAAAGDAVLDAGRLITPAVTASLANFGVTAPEVFRKIRVAILTTGDEVVAPEATSLDPWQLRNSNSVALRSIVSQQALVQVVTHQHVIDDRQSLSAAVAQALLAADVVLMTGGVSKGDYDYVPDVIAEAGAEIRFHGLPIRPGKPILGAVGPAGGLILALPGNPVSATINCHRFAIPLIHKMAGRQHWMRQPALVTLDAPLRKTIPLHAMLLARITGPGMATLVESKGSGDLVAMAKSDGYVCVSPQEDSPGPWPMFRW
ncbi:molybdopterin molybdotransferase MoeA [Roseiconus lacunae]|uniref:molybdopterin molybdotransferase MoeA n=1 Tax=Roseiconus lacunae TaxID=2605694 RepID=UPI0011F35D83|nr:molybdopterin molybdotransferase MoeA [Roseiconus lacunae]WRQ53157.1 molybdopterin molybdotransferase MoeA [Stieleria sp. HD01]